ncbi:hypothetical protein B6U96_10430 [Archaeoglobales archaeon ex4484_92]|nr:MAG: hypothetical protein B6U96_10430 [Archaeoglobales archaeon ex4484_92]
MILIFGYHGSQIIAQVFFPKDVFESRCLTVLSNPDLLWMDVKILYFYDINTRMVKDTRFIKLFSLIPVVDARRR